MQVVTAGELSPAQVEALLQLAQSTLPRSSKILILLN
jgi:hypothetical protein